MNLVNNHHLLYHLMYLERSIIGRKVVHQVPGYLAR